MQINIIIPSFNESASTHRLQGGDPENIIEHAQGSDNTAQPTLKAGAAVHKEGPVYTINPGITGASGKVPYFVHANALPCSLYTAGMLTTGYFRFKSDSQKPLLKINSWFMRFDKTWGSGGDETLNPLPKD